MQLTLLPAPPTQAPVIDRVLMDAVLQFSDDEQPVSPSQVLLPGRKLYALELADAPARFAVRVDRAGEYVLFTQHRPEEFEMRWLTAGSELAPITSHVFKPDHEHDETVSSVGITNPGALDVKKFNRWLSELLQSKGQDIFRMKGVLNLQGHDERFVFQGVHMLFDGRPDRPWGDEPRKNLLIFIGRQLDRAALTREFERCLA